MSNKETHNNMLNISLTDSHSAQKPETKNFTLIYHPFLAAALKKLEIRHPGEAAVFINQLAFWHNTTAGELTRDGRKWIYNSYEDWTQQLPSLKPWQLGTMVRDLESLGMIQKSCYAHLRQELLNDSVAWHTHNTSSWITLDVERIIELTNWHPIKAQIVQSLKPLPCIEIENRTTETSESNTAPSETQQRSIYIENKKVSESSSAQKNEAREIIQEQPIIPELPTLALKQENFVAPNCSLEEVISDHSLEQLNSDYSLGEVNNDCSLEHVESDRSLENEVTHEDRLPDEHQANNTTYEVCNLHSLTNMSNEVIESPLEEENLKLREVRDAVGKLTRELKELVAQFTLIDLRKALTIYRERIAHTAIHNPYRWLKKCLQERWWMTQDPRKFNEAPKPANERLSQELKDWFEWAITQGICLPAAIAELPEKMGLICAQVPILNRRPFDPPYDLIPIEQLAREYPRN